MVDFKYKKNAYLFYTIHKIRNSFKGFGKGAHSRGVGKADVAGAEIPERAAGYERHFLLFQKLFRKVLAV